MKIHRAKVTSHLRRAILTLGLLMIGVVCFLSFTKSTRMQSDELPASDRVEQNFVLGKLAFQRTVIFTSGFANNWVMTANPNGSGEVVIAPDGGGIPTHNGKPAWSPDGTKMVYETNVFGLYVMNADGSNKTRLTNNMDQHPSWSATGKIAFERAGQIWTMNADGTNQTQFSAITQPSPVAPAWSPDGTILAFVSSGEIWVINADGTNERRVTNNATVDADPAWSPNGSKIIFGKGSTGIAVINLDGTNETILTNVIQDGRPDWSSDGTKIAFVRRGAAENGIYVMDATGANQLRIIADIPTQPGRNENDYPAWQPVPAPPNTYTISGRITRVGAGLGNVTVNLSGTVTATTTTDSFGNYQFSNLPENGNFTITPALSNHTFTPPSRTFNNLNTNQVADFTATEICVGVNCVTNGRIVFARNDAEIYVMNPDGTGQTNLTNNAANDKEPAYSPDGGKIVFVSNRDGNYELYVMNVDGTGIVRLTNNSAEDRLPSYSPDGSKIVFVSQRDGNREIYRMNADGSNQIRLTTNTIDDDTPSYSPNGNTIIFVEFATGVGYNLYTMNADGTNQVNLTNQPGFYYYPSYSPDGSKIIFSYGGDITGQAIYTMNANGTNRTLFASGYRFPSYSPDGTKVLLLGGISAIQLRGVYVAPATGGEPVRLTFELDYMPKWQPLRPVRPVAFDFDGDRKSDVSVFRPSNAYWYLNRSQAGFTYQQFGISTDKLAPADYDGDGKTDVAVFRENPSDPTRAYFYIWQSSTNTYSFAQFGATGDAPLAGDWDGDGRADLTVYRNGAQPSGQSSFFYRPSSQPATDFVAVPWGASGDKPVAADYDGDGKTDAAVFRPSTATWHVLQSSNNQLYAVQFGAAGDRAVPADYDGDGRADVAVYRAGSWYVLGSQQGFNATQFGVDTDVPVPADYDGDGRTDRAVFRAGTWHLLQTTNNYTSVPFGVAGDLPVPASYVP